MRPQRGDVLPWPGERYVNRTAADAREGLGWDGLLGLVTVCDCRARLLPQRGMVRFDADPVAALEKGISRWKKRRGTPTSAGPIPLSLRIVVQQRRHVVAFELLAAAEEVEFHDEPEAGDRAAQ